MYIEWENLGVVVEMVAVQLYFSGFPLLNTGTLSCFVCFLKFFLLFTSFFFCAVVCRVYLTLNKIIY